MSISSLLNFFCHKSLRSVSRRPKHEASSTELLEVRSLLTGFAWSDSNSLTISFAPDGTDVAGNKSELNADLKHLGTSAQWQSTIVSAFQTWMREVGFSISVVKDSGISFGSSGATHGDPRFGDVRVAAIPLTSGVLATAIPQSTFISGTWAGDVMLNSSVDLKSLDELYALAFHEAGHVLGLEHSTDPRSPMFDHCGTTVLQPTAQDIANLRQLYGVGSPATPSVETDDSLNGRADHAERIAAIGTNGLFPHFEVTGQIRKAGDIDTFVFRPRDAASEAPEVTTIVLRTTSPGLIPRLSIATRSGQKVEHKIVANGNGLVILQCRDLEPDTDYLVRVASATSVAAFLSGSYELGITFSESAQSFETLAKGVLDRETQQRSFDLYSAKSQLINFQLSTLTSKPSQQGAAVILSIYSESDRLVFRVVTRPGETVTDKTVLLGTGKYRIVVNVLSARTADIRELQFFVRASRISSDAGPLPNNPLGKPAVGPGGSIPYVYPTNVTSTKPLIVMPPVVTTPAGKPVTPVVPPFTWQQLIEQYAWYSAP